MAIKFSEDNTLSSLADIAQVSHVCLGHGYWVIGERSIPLVHLYRKAISSFQCKTPKSHFCSTRGTH